MIKYQHIFEKMADDLESLLENGSIKITPPPPRKVIACPLCLRVFTMEALEHKRLVPEHVPSESMGGKVKALTCAECNHKHGSRFEGPLVQKLQYEDFGRKVIGASAESTFVFDETKINTHIEFLGEKRIQLNYDSRKSHPNHVSIIQDLVNQQTIPSVSFIPKKKFDERNADMGILRIAYLQIFIESGYKLLTNKNMGVVREQLQSPEKSLLPDFGITDKNVPDYLPSFGIVIEPKHLQSFFVCVELKSKLGKKFRFGVLLPLGTKGGLEIYDFSAQYNSSGNWPELIIKPISIST